MRRLLKILALSSLTFNFRSEAANVTPHPFKITFGSCARQTNKEQSWNALSKENSDVLLLLGDNVYANATDEKTLSQAYETLNAQPDFQTLIRQTRVLATWDDHDYGINDSGAENPLKNESRKQMLDFFKESADSPRRTQEGGIYASYDFKHKNQKIRILVLDTRWNRGPLDKLSRPEDVQERAKIGMGKILVNSDKNSTMLGKAQWEWLETEFKKPSDLLILASSVQLLSEFTGWESWANFPHEQKKMLDMIKKYSPKFKKFFILSGDIHRAEVLRVDGILPKPLFEITSSGLTEVATSFPKNKARIKHYIGFNYGLIEIQKNLKVRISLKDRAGGTRIVQDI
ncbi:MAG: alkaline phosphatase family protein [Oligoflexales bacterium]|nr:alkaline phosphatase family protein [Oligoflexales bacterium]